MYTKDIKSKISSLQQAIWKIRDAQALIEDAGVTMLPRRCYDLMSLLENEIDALHTRATATTEEV